MNGRRWYRKYNKEIEEADDPTDNDFLSEAHMDEFNKLSHTMLTLQQREEVHKVFYESRSEKEFRSAMTTILGRLVTEEELVVLWGEFDEEDDEETMEEAQKEMNRAGFEQEVGELTTEQEMPIAELLAKYGIVKGESADNDDEEEEDDGDDADDDDKDGEDEKGESGKAVNGAEGRGKSKGGQSVFRSEKAGLQFPVGRVHRYLKQG